MIGNVPFCTTKFVYEGSRNPGAELHDSKNGHTSDHWVLDDGIVFLRRQIQNGIETISSMKVDAITYGTLVSVTENFSKYHTDALQLLLQGLH